MISAGALFIAVIFLLGVIGPGSRLDGNKIEIQDSWTRVSGDSIASIDSFRNEASFVNTVTRDQAHGRSLCFFSKNVYFDVKIDDEVVYSFHPISADVYGKFYGTCPHIIDLGAVDDSSVITIEAETINGSKGSFTYLTLQDGGVFNIEMIRSSIVPSAISIIITFMGLCLIIGGLSILKNTYTGKEIAAMGLFAMDAGIWTSCSSGIISLVLGSPVTMHFVNYISLILLPGLAVIFVFILTGHKARLLTNILMAIISATLVFDIAMAATGRSTYHDLLIMTHIECVIAVFYSFYCIISTLRTTRKMRSTRITITVAFMAVAAGGFIDLIRYLNGTSARDTAYFFRIGLMVFVMALGINELNALLYYRKYEDEAEQMSKLAFTDPLTGLQNRMAFEEHEEYVKTKGSGEYIIIQFDINNLKKVNDTFGHKAGDRHIMAAAAFIKNCFGKLGSCYRTGGDEFIVVIDEPKDQAQLDEAFESFKRMIDEHNTRRNLVIKLEVPYGYERFDIGSTDIEGAIRIADGKMYTMKKQMKGAT
ncbi:MAG: diguanylate cyclase [Clostridiales bacterium]|nr:diguanylate cyclase [Clostridiales bacterium]